MNKTRTLRMTAFTTMLILVVMLATFLVVRVSAHAAPAPGETYIVRVPTTGHLPYFHPNMLSCQRDPVNRICTITIKNTLGATLSVTLNGTVVFTLAPHQLNTITYKRKGTLIYGIGVPSDTHQLTVNVT